MLTAPIVHTRTLNEDFLSGFLVRPDYFKSEDIDWARRLIRASTADIDLMKGERYVVLDNGKIRIAGIVAVTSELANKVNRAIDSRFFFDKQGRNIYAFIGICTKSPLQSNIAFTYNDFFDIFEKYVMPVFNYKVVETQLVHESVSIEKIGFVDKPEDEGIILNQCTIYESTYESDKKLFDYYLCHEEQNFSFCSNISKYQAIKESVFNYITTAPNNIKRLKMDMPSINHAAKEQEETDYNQFKEKYRERLIRELMPECSQDEKFIKSILDDLSVIESVLEKLRKGEITETKHYKVVKLNKRLHSVSGYSKNIQPPICLIKKEEKNDF